MHDTQRRVRWILYAVLHPDLLHNVAFQTLDQVTLQYDVAGLV